MKELRGLASLKKLDRPVVMAIGVFDGVHRGHQKVIQHCIQEASKVNGLSAVLTFHPHPAKIIRPESAPKLLTTEEQDRELFSELGVQVCVTIDFNEELQQMHAEEFLKLLLKYCPHLRGIVVGFRWHFGKDRDGDFLLLKKFADAHHLTATEVEPLMDDVGGEVVSSTNIRKFISQGQMKEAEMLLGRPYAIKATVVTGDGRGRKIGFPTANLKTQNELIPPVGVYAVKVKIENKTYLGAMNIGFRPTFESETKHILTQEVHLLDFSGDLPGRKIEVDFEMKLRDEKKFASAEELHAQIVHDIESVRTATT